MKRLYQLTGIISDLALYKQYYLIIDPTSYRLGLITKALPLH